MAQNSSFECLVAFVGLLAGLGYARFMRFCEFCAARVWILCVLSDCGASAEGYFVGAEGLTTAARVKFLAAENDFLAAENEFLAARVLRVAARVLSAPR